MGGEEGGEEEDSDQNNSIKETVRINDSLKDTEMGRGVNKYLTDEQNL